MTMRRQVVINTKGPTVMLIADMQLKEEGVLAMARWVQEHRPDCVPEKGFNTIYDLLPHNLLEARHDKPEELRAISGNELLVEFAGRKCYDSFAEKAGKKSNREYIQNTQAGPVPHASILYHAKMSFFLAGVSRRVSHELIRNYVGADRDEEGSPSQESTRFTHHYGHFVCPPWILGGLDGDPSDQAQIREFEKTMQYAYDRYCYFIETEVGSFKDSHGHEPKGLDRKRIYEAAAMILPSAAETSFIWTTNPMALKKLFKERGAPEADAEFQRLVAIWKPYVEALYPNLFT